MNNSHHTERVMEDALRPLRHKMGWLGRAWVVLLLLVCASAVYAYFLQFKHGLVVTGMRDYSPWGLYIVLFVFLVAVSLVGAVISSVLRLSNFEFRRPLTRIAEFIAVAAIMFAALAIFVDMGRPERLYKVFTSGRLQSPIIWDVIVVNTYLVITLLLLYIPMIPDIAYCRDHLHDVSWWRKKMYSILALNWHGTDAQEDLLHKSEKILVVLIIPVAVSIHTVTSWLFALTHRPGWDSTAFGAYFVSGAFVVGVACVIVAMYIMRQAFGLKAYLTDQHFDLTGKLLVLLSLVYLYFNISEYLVPAFKMAKKKAYLLDMLFFGQYSMIFWGAMIVGVLLPVIVPVFKKGRTPKVLAALALCVVIAHWWKRFAIVVPPLANSMVPIDLVPPAWVTYVPSWQEWAITAGLLAGTLLVITILTRLFPVIPVSEIVHGKFRKTEGEQGAPAYELLAIHDQEDNHA